MLGGPGRVLRVVNADCQHCLHRAHSCQVRPHRQMPPPPGCDDNARFSFSPMVPPLKLLSSIHPIKMAPKFPPLALVSVIHSSRVASLTTTCPHLPMSPRKSHAPRWPLPPFPGLLPLQFSSLSQQVLTEHLLRVRSHTRLAGGFDDDHEGQFVPQ